MNEVLKVFLSLSLSGSLLILILFACQKVFRDRISRQWQYYLWLIVIARLLLPFAPDTNLTGNFLHLLENVQTQVTGRSLPSAKPDLPAAGTAVSDTFAGRAEDFETDNQTDLLLPENLPLQDIVLLLKNNIWLVWLVTALILLIRKITLYQSFVRYVKAGQAPVSDVALLNRLAEAATRMGIKKPVDLCVNPLISSPLLIGFFRPCIVLPDQKLSERDFHYTVLHELTHFKRLDMFYKWLVQVTVCLHWFNPLVSRMGRELGRACEFSCDEAVISKLALSDRQAYGRTLLNAAAPGKWRVSSAFAPLSENKKILKERLDAIMKFRKKSKAAASAAILLSAVLLCGAAYAGAYAADSRNEISGSREESLKQNFKKYESFGVIYNPEDDTVYFYDEPVRLFVDFSSDKEADVDYAFDLFYQDSKPDSALYLKAVEDSNGEVIAIEPLENEIADDLLGADETDELEEPVFADKDNYGKDWDFICMDATQIIGQYDITAKDLTKEQADEAVNTWIKKCNAKQGLYTLKQQTSAGYTTYLYYNGGGRYPWYMSVDNGTLILNLYSDSELVTDDGYFLIYFTSPKEYNKIKLYLDGKRL